VSAGHFSSRCRKATGISNAYLSQLESGKIQQPSPVMLNKLSELYQVSYADILELAGYPVPDRSNKATSYSRLASRMGPTTKEEEDELLEYLEFLRSRRKRGQRR
jgi:transcriptional regulator with XRE-family HTH domain